MHPRLHGFTDSASRSGRRPRRERAGRFERRRVQRSFESACSLFAAVYDRLRLAAVGERGRIVNPCNPCNPWTTFDLSFAAWLTKQRCFATRSAEARRAGGRGVDDSGHAGYCRPMRRPGAARGGHAVRGAAARANREPDRRRSRHARGDLRADYSDRRQRPRRARGAGGALHRSRARRRAGGVARGVSRRPRGVRSLLPIVARRAVHRAVDARSGFGADRRRDRRGHRIPPAAPARSSRMVRTHTLQGTFGDPYYGGNANFVGWDLIGYPGRAHST